jgi:hypothetical protein
MRTRRSGGASKSRRAADEHGCGESAEAAMNDVTRILRSIDAVVSLLPLKKDKDYKLSLIGDVKLGDRAAVGVRIAKKGHRDVSLFFDKAKGHLVKSEFVIKDIKGGGNKEMMQATLYYDYKEFQGTRRPTRLVIERDGKKFADTQLTEIQLLEKLDDGTFDRP